MSRLPGTGTEKVFMRIWKGIDAEHNSNVGKMTLFVESENPDLAVVELILKQHPDIKAIYFGAGEVDILQFTFINKLHALRKRYGILLLMECSYDNMITYDIRSYFDVVVLRIPVDSIYGNEQIKLRTGTQVYIRGINDFKNNSLATLKNGQYLNDIELYKDEVQL